MGLRAWIYDQAMLPVTTTWYEEVLNRLEPGARLLDIGIGTGGALANNADQVLRDGIDVVGIDIDADYVQKARERLHEVGLADTVHVELQSVYDYKDGNFDAAYFAASFMLLPDPAKALQHVLTQLKPGGRVYFTQTFQERPSPLMEKVKPMLKTVTTIDFGNVTYEADFLKTLSEVGVEVIENTKMKANRSRSYRLIVAKPEDA